MLDDRLNLMSVSEYTQMIAKGAVVIAVVLMSRQHSTQAIMKFGHRHPDRDQACPNASSSLASR